MTTKDIIFHENVRTKLLEGVRKAAEAIGCTLGPKGQNVILEQKGTFPRITKDGVSVAKEIHFEDPFENMGAQLLAQVSQKTCDDAGDGTTTASVLTYNILLRGMRAINMGANPVLIKAGIEESAKKVIDHIMQHARPVSSNDDLRSIATISANGEKEIGELLANAFREVGEDGSITLSPGQTKETVLEFQPGINLNFGYAESAQANVTHKDTMTYEFPNAYVFFHDADITTEKVRKIVEEIGVDPRKGEVPIPVVLFAHSFDMNEALPLINLNNFHKVLRVCPVVLPPIGEEENRSYQYDFLTDFCTITGGRMMEREMGDMFSKHFSKDYFGQVEMAVIGRTKLALIGGKGAESDIEAQKKSIECELEAYGKRIEKDESYERHLKRRLQHFNPMAIIRAGGVTKAEISERIDRIDDAMHAVRAAIEKGIVPGGGVALLRAMYDFDDNGLTFNILKDSLRASFDTILKNAGLSPETFERDLKAKTYEWGVNAATGELCDMFENCIIDPAKVVISCLENAVSIAGLLLTTATMISYHDRDPNPLTDFKLKM